MNEMGRPVNAFVLCILTVVAAFGLVSSNGYAAEIQFHLDKRFSSHLPVGNAKSARVLAEGESLTISIELESMAAKKLADLSMQHLGQWIYLRADNKILFSGVLQTPIKDGKFQIQGDFTRQEAEEIVSVLLAN